VRPEEESREIQVPLNPHEPPIVHHPRNACTLLPEIERKVARRETDRRTDRRTDRQTDRQTTRLTFVILQARSSRFVTSKSRDSSKTRLARNLPDLLAVFRIFISANTDPGSFVNRVIGPRIIRCKLHSHAQCRRSRRIAATRGNEIGQFTANRFTRCSRAALSYLTDISRPLSDIRSER